MQKADGIGSPADRNPGINYLLGRKLRARRRVRTGEISKGSEKSVE
jgi:hypothetical protein